MPSFNTIRIDTFTNGCGQWSMTAWDTAVAGGLVVRREGKDSRALREAKAEAVRLLSEKGAHA